MQSLINYRNGDPSFSGLLSDEGGTDDMQGRFRLGSVSDLNGLCRNLPKDQSAPACMHQRRAGLVLGVYTASKLEDLLAWLVGIVP